MAKYLIIGGVAGGATTAARLRRLDEGAEIVLFERGDYISYANCGLPYYLGGAIKERDRLFVQTPEKMRAAFGLDVRVRSEVMRIDRERKTVEVRRVDTGETYTEGYDKLVLSPGANPVRPPIPGVNLPGIYTLRNVTDMDRIKEEIDGGRVRRALIVGAGYIGLEMAENLHDQGIKVTVVELLDQMINVLDYEMAAQVHQHLKTKNVEFYLGDGVASIFEGDRSGGGAGNSLNVRLRSGRDLGADMVLLSIGVKPDTALARDAGLAIGDAGGIRTDEHMQTSDPDIYAVGDAVEVFQPLTGRSMLIPLAGPANKQGRIAADNIVFGNTRRYTGSIGTAIAKVFDLTVATTGLSEKVLRREGIPCVASITHGSSHAGYYPGAMPQTIKVIFTPDDGRLLGAQIVGYDGVDKRIDVFASVLKKRGNIYDLQDVEHAYAPPFSSAKDPVNVAGFVAENILHGVVNVVHWHELEGLDPDETFYLDVRTPEEHRLGTVEGAVNIPHTSLRDHLDEIPRDKRIIVYCAAGYRAYVACRILMQNGFERVCNLSGGYTTYKTVMQKQSNEDIFGGNYIDKDDVIYQTESGARSGEGRTVEIDARGLQCPGPIKKLSDEMGKLQAGDMILETATDPGFANDVDSWCRMTGHRLLQLDRDDGIIIAKIRKETSGEPSIGPQRNGKQLTMVVFSGELDKALAAFVIAQGAASTGKKVTLFFTFWGLNILKRRRKPRVRKDLMGRMFGWMLPGSSRGLKLSKLHMMGMGTRLMRHRMKSLNVDSLETMIETVRSAGVELVACQMSMDVMGVKREELIDGVTIGGVASYMESAGQSRVNLFV